MSRLILIVILFPLMSWGAGELSPSFTLDGKLYQDTDHTIPLSESNVKLRLQILNGTKTCVLYEEEQYVDVSQSEGYFNVQVGSTVGAGKRVSGSDPGNSMVAVYQNTVAIPATGCAGNSSAAVAHSKRYLKIFVTKNGSSAEEVLSPDLEIGSMPTASVAQTLQGYSPTSFLILGPGDLTQTNMQNLFATGNVQRLTDIINSYGTNGTIQIPSNTSNPGSAQAGEIWYDSVTNELKYYNGTSHLALGVAGGTQVTSVTAASPLLSSGGTTPQISLPKATTSVDGYLDHTDWTAFNSKLDAATIFAGDVSGTASSLTVDMVGGSTAANIHSATVLANGATSTNTASTIVRRDASGNFSAGTISATLSGAVILPAEGGGASTVRLQGPATAGSNYTVKWPNAQGAASQVLTNDGNGNLSWATPSTTATSYSGTLPVANGGTNSATALTNNKIMVSSGGAIVESGALANGQLLIGSTGAAPVVGNLTAGSGVSITNSAGGITIAATGSGGTVTNVSGTAPISIANGGTTPTVSLANGSATGQVLRWDGTSAWQSTKLNYMDLINSLAASPWPAADCDPGEAVVWSAATDSFVCAGIIPSVAGTAELDNGKIWLGDGTNKAQAVTISGDASLSNSGVLTLENSGATAGTFKSVVVDAKGRVTSGTNPTTLSGFGISDAVRNGGNTGTITSGIDTAKPASPSTGDLFVATDVQKLYRYNGSIWDLISSASGSGGTLTALTGDVSASGSGSVTATVNSVGGSTAANVHSAELAANAATHLNTVSTIVKRDGSGNFTAGTITANLSGNVTGNVTGNLTGNVTGAASLNILKAGDTMGGNLTFGSGFGNIYTDSGSNTVTVRAPTTVTTSYVLRLPVAQGTASQVLTNDGSGNLSWTTPSTTATSYSGVLPVANGGTNSSTVLTNNKIMVSSGGAIVESAALTNGQLLIGSTGAAPVVANITAGTGISVTNGAGSLTIATTGLQSTSLLNGKILIGNGSDVATAVTPSQDVAISNTGVTQVNRIQNRIVNASPVSGGVMSWDAATTSWVGKAFPACTTSQAPYWNSSTDAIECQTIQASSGSISGTVGVANGGTGATTLTAYGILMGNGTSAVSAIAPGTTNYVLTSNGAGAAPTWQAPLLSGSSGTANYVARWTASTTLGSGALYDNGTSVGVGTATPRSALDVQGVILGKPAVAAAAATIDFSGGNIQYTTSNCGSFQFNHLKDGGSYTFIVKGATSTTCSFTAYAGNGAGSGNITVHMPPDHGATTASKHTIYNMIVAGSDVYIAWTPGY